MHGPLGAPIRYDPAMHILDTERLRLRQLQTEDAAFILKLLNEPAFIQNIADKGVRNLEDAIAYLRNGPLASYERHGFGLYLVELKQGNTPVGICGVIRRETLEHPDIGYAFLEKYSGRGYGYESAAAVLIYARQQLGLTRVVAITAPDNLASIRILEKIGFIYQAMINLPDHASQSRYFVNEL